MKISEQVKSVIEAEGITKEYLYSMVESAAVTSISGFNKRFYNWLFKVDGDQIIFMALDTNVVVDGEGDLVYDDHSKCDGMGCRECSWTGQTAKRIVDTTEVKLNKAYAQW